MQIQHVQMNKILEIFYFRNAILAEHKYAQIDKIGQAVYAFDPIIIQVKKY